MSMIASQFVTSPFDLDNKVAYQKWKVWKLEHAAKRPDDLKVKIADPDNLAEHEIQAVIRCCQANNMAIYILKSKDDVSKATIKHFGQQLGLNRLDSNICADEDSITSLTYRSDGRQKGYIPYSNMRLSWHTDGYYNRPEQTIRALIMFCVQPAAEGGENTLLDHELLYIYLRDRNPAYISALMHPEAMTIPPNQEGDEEIRGRQSGPVFSVHPEHGTLHMRYSARTRNIIWRDDPLTLEAVACITDYLQGERSSLMHYRLNAGEGIICNNVLHNRSAFSDDKTHKRLLYRARYFDRIKGTEQDQLTA